MNWLNVYNIKQSYAYSVFTVISVEKCTGIRVRRKSFNYEQFKYTFCVSDTTDVFVLQFYYWLNYKKKLQMFIRKGRFKFIVLAFCHFDIKLYKIPSAHIMTIYLL